MEYAGFWRRVGAALIDNILVNVVAFVIGLIWGVIFGDSGGALAVLYVLIIAGYFVYFAVMESSTSQATVGKIALGIQVTGGGGERISFGRALGRNLAEVLSGLPTLFIGYLLVAFTERKRGLHDMIASTLVVKKGTAAGTASAEAPM
jgi:uncharacterized RDD family membrane protein YckC